MPEYLPALHGVSFSEAAAEAIAVDHERVLLTCIELRHSEFVDDDGEPYAIRIVADNEDFEATLEDGAPMDAGETVTFKAVPLQISGPDETDSSEAPMLRVAIDGISALVVPQLDLAVQTLEPVMMTIRLYAADDPSGPAMMPVMPPMVLRDVEVGETQVTASASFADPANRGFPRRDYLLTEYPGLGA
jgi:hypothetical protein